MYVRLFQDFCQAFLSVDITFPGALAVSVCQIFHSRALMLFTRTCVCLLQDSHPPYVGWCSWDWFDMVHRLEAGPSVCPLHQWQVQN